jgi:hypothetical protein
VIAAMEQIASAIGSICSVASRLTFFASRSETGL